MRDSIEKWYKSYSIGTPVQSLISKLAKEKQREWNMMKVEHRHEWGDKIDTAFNFYKQELTRKLEKKGINQEHINQILEQLSNEED